MKKNILLCLLGILIIRVCVANDIVDAINDYYSDEVKNGNLEWKLGVSSTLIEDKKNSDFYGYNNLLDKKSETAWVEGVDGFGKNEFFLMPVYRDDGAMFNYRKNKKIKIFFNIKNGYCKSEDLFYKNNRVKKAKVTIYDVPINADINSMFVDGDPQIIWEEIIELVDDLRESQSFAFSIKLKNIDSYCIPEVVLKFEILDVYKGTMFDDTAISEVDVWGEYITEE